MIPEYLDTLPGAIVRFVVDEMQKMDMAASAWSALNDDVREQRLDAMAVRADELAQKLCDDIAAEGFQTLRGTLEQVTFKDGIKLTIKASRHEVDRHAIADAAGQAILLVLPQKSMEIQTTAVVGAQESLL